GVAFDCDDECGEAAVADDASKLLLCFEHAGGGPAQRSPEDQRLTLRWVRRTISSIDSQGLVDASVRFSEPVTPSRVSVSVSSIPSRSELAAPGWVWSSS